MIPNNWTLYRYEAVPTWTGWYENETGVCVGFLASDGEVFSFDVATDAVVSLGKLDAE